MAQKWIESFRSDKRHPHFSRRTVYGYRHLLGFHHKYWWNHKQRQRQFARGSFSSWGTRSLVYRDKDPRGNKHDDVAIKREDPDRWSVFSPINPRRQPRSNFRK